MAQGASKKRRAGPDTAVNVEALARALGVTPASIKVWKRISGCPLPDASGRYKISEWREWQEKNRGKAQTPPPGAILSKYELECQKLAKQIERMDMDNAASRKLLVEVEKVREWFLKAAQVVRVELMAIAGKLAARVPGMTPPAAKAAIDEAINEALQAIHTHPWDEKSNR